MQPARLQAGQRRLGAVRTGSRVAPVRPKMPEVRTENPDQLRKKKREPPLPAPSNEYSAPSLTNVNKRRRPGPGRSALSFFGPCPFCLESVLFVQNNFSSRMACPLCWVSVPEFFLVTRPAASGDIFRMRGDPRAWVSPPHQANLKRCGEN